MFYLIPYLCRLDYYLLWIPVIILPWILLIAFSIIIILRINFNIFVNCSVSNLRVFKAVQIACITMVHKLVFTFSVDFVVSWINNISRNWTSNSTQFTSSKGIRHIYNISLYQCIQCFAYSILHLKFIYAIIIRLAIFLIGCLFIFTDRNISR